MNKHKNNLTLTASADIAQGICVKFTSSDETKVEACAATDSTCIGVTKLDALSGGTVAVELLGVSNLTINAVASAAISAGESVYLAASGKVQPAPTSGTVYCIGRALCSAVADDLVEFAHCLPTKEVFTS